MDIHAPHQPVHTWRDFTIHLTIVTIGLFIALSLEGLVEYVHHRHLVKEARENIRRELEDNHRAAQEDLKLLDRNVAQQQADIATVHTLEEHFKDIHGSIAITNSMNFDPLSDAAWRTARDTGALGYMPYDEVQHDSDLYMLSDLVNTTAIEVGKKDFEAGAPLKMGIPLDKLPADEYLRLLRDNATVEIQFLTLRQFVLQFDQQCSDALKH